MKQNLLMLFLVTAFFSVSGQGSFVKNGSFYFSWGYNEEWYSKSNIHVVQPGLGNDYSFENIEAHDHIGWDRLLQSQLSIPQYNYRIGYFFNKKQDLGLEINFDHTKYVVVEGQTNHISGKMGGRSVDTSILITPQTLSYELNNGANFFLINLVKKIKIYETPNEFFNACGLVKFGVGPVVPHVQNTIFGISDVPHFQLGGWDTGLEAGIKVTIKNHVYLEFTNKVDYARYFDLRVNSGDVNQSFWCYELILSLGYTFHTGKKTSVTQ